MEINSQINTFTGGLNLDDDITMIQKNQYRWAQNVRIVTDNEGTSGILLNIEDVRLYSGGLSASEIILGTATTRWYNTAKGIVEECGVVVTKELYADTWINNIWVVTDFNTKEPTWKFIISATLDLSNNVSIVTNFESNELSKVYITDGNSAIKLINISAEYPYTKDYPITDKFYFDIIPNSTLFPIKLETLTNGLLDSGKVQYCFLLFTLHGTESAISPLGDLIPLSANIRKGESKAVKGQLLNENTGLGCKLKIVFNNTSNFNKLRIIRIHYIDNISVPTITVINEIDISTDLGEQTVYYTDNGKLFLTVLSFDQFRFLVPYDFNAKVITKTQNRLFAANIKENTWDVEYDSRAYRCDMYGNITLKSNSGEDIYGRLTADGKIDGENIPYNHDCINPYNLLSNDLNVNGTEFIYRPDGLLGGIGPNISYKFTFAELVLSSTNTQEGIPANDLDLNATAASTNEIKIVYQDGTLAEAQHISNSTASIHNYSDAQICAKYLGYMRDEIYRFGIVFYNKKGIPSPVHWIGDIRMPSTQNTSDINSVLYPFHTGKYSSAYNKIVEQIAYALGIEFTVTNVPADVTSWEIVRCDRTQEDRTIVSQGIIGNLIKFDSWEGDGSAGEYAFGTNDIRPLPLFNLGEKFHVKYWHGDDPNIDVFEKVDNYVEFVSPDIAISKDIILPSVQNSKLHCLYKVSTYNHHINVTNTTYGKPLGYRQTKVDVVWDEEQKENDKWFGNIILDDIRGQLRFNAGSGTKGAQGNDEAREWYEKQMLFKYYNIKHENDLRLFSINDAIISKILPYQELLNDTKNHAQSIYAKQYINTSIAGFELFGNHGINCVLHLKDFNKTSGANGNTDQVFNYLNTTNICNIKRVIIPYNGNGYSERSNSIYISCGLCKSRYDNKGICYGGDTYLCIFDYLNTSLNQVKNDLNEKRSDRMNTVCYIPLESVVNTNLFSSDSYHNTVNGLSGDNLILNEPIVLANGYTQKKPLYEYNPAYTAASTVLNYVPKGLYEKDNVVSMTRIACSELKTNNELIDQWAKFKFANYLDVDSKYGQITNLKIFKNKLYYFLDSAVGIAAVNERSLISDNNPGLLTLGTGGILTRYDYLITQNGDSIVNDKSITDSENALYWHDYDKNVLCLLSLNGFLELSKVGKVQTYLNRLPDSARRNPVSFFDKKYNEVWFKIYDRCLIYNENLLKFTSFYSHNPNWFFPFSTKLITIKDNNCYYLHNMYDMDLIEKDERISYVLFVVNDNVTYTKTFDNQWFVADLADVEHPNNPHIVKNVFFKTKNQETEPIDYTNIENREDNYRFAISREKQDNAAQQEQTNASYAGRMRGKYLICNYTFDCNNNREFKLPYVKTTYRYSML